MIRSQILLDPKLIEEVKKISRQRGWSQSETIRKLLGHALVWGEENGADLPKTGREVIYDLAHFSFKNPRVDGFKEIFSVGGRTPEIRILSDEVFREYWKTKSFSSAVEYQILKMAEELKNYSPRGSLVVRRAYVVPGLDNPPGPRFLSLKPRQILAAVKAFYDFAIQHEYFVKEGSQICVFFHPFFDPKPLEVPVRPGAVLPYGGYAAPLNDKTSRVEVFAVWGNNEGVQSFDAIDRYVVDPLRKIILTKDIPQKNWMFCTTVKSQSDKIAVPSERQFEQVLSDAEILEVGRVVWELAQKYGLRRVEFTFDGQDTIHFNESAPYRIFEKEVKSIDRKGRVVVVKTVRDVDKLSRLDKERAGEVIVYIDKSIVENRSYEILNSVAGLAQKFMVLYPGLSATAHAMRVLNDFGHTAVVVGNRIFKDSEELVIKRVGDQIDIKSLSASRIGNLAVNLFDAKLYGREIVGGKAMNLSLLKSKGYNVPHGIVLTTKNGKGLSASLWKEIVDIFKVDAKKKYAIRSSANAEDQSEHSFAGQFDTFLKVPFPELLRNINRVFASTESEAVKQYLQSLGRKVEIKMAVVVQEMVDVEKSGVVFGKDVQTGDEDLMVIDVTAGLGEGVVSGTAETQRVLYSRSKDVLVGEKESSGKRFLTRTEIDSLVEMAINVERMMGGIQDIEWAIDRKGTIWLIQTRGL